MKKNMLTIVLTAFAAVTLFSFDLPDAWRKAGSKPDSYDMGIDKGAGQNGENAATIRSNTKKIRGFGTLMQSCAAHQYLGRKIRMTGYVRSKNVKGWAGLWLRVDGASITSDPLGFDNMSDRPIRKTTAWQKYEIIMEVPANANNLAYGALLVGEGQIWFNKITFEIMNDSVAVNKKECNVCSTILKEPANLDFEK